jgi:LPS sulfotransferase NodH/glycosyltransferase involved in cell wall biosynthesis
LICTTERTGSTLLCDLLASTGVAGKPSEYFLPNDIHRFSKMWQTNTFAEYLSAFFRTTASVTGVAGAKVLIRYFPTLLAQLRQLPGIKPDATDGELLAHSFPNLHYIFLTRTDKLRQAISYIRAVGTGYWHHKIRADTATPLWTGVDRATGAADPDFDGSLIDRQMETLQQHETIWRDFFRRNAIEPLEIVYEDLAADYVMQTRRVLEFLGVPWSPSATIRAPSLVKQADEITQEWVARYQAEKFGAKPTPAKDASARTQVRLVIPKASLLGGVTSWALRLADWSRKNAPDHNVRVLVICDYHEPQELPPFIEQAFRPYVDQFRISANATETQKGKELAEQLAKDRVSILVPNFSSTACLAGTFLADSGMRTIGVCHADQPLYYDLLAKFWYLWDSVVAVSCRCCEEVKRRCGRHVSEPKLIHYGAPSTAFCDRDPSARLNIAYIGRLAQRQKRATDLIELCHRLELHGVIFRLYIVGDGPERNVLEHYLAPFALSDGDSQVRFLGAQPPSRVADVLARCHAFVLPSEFEGLSIAVLEAMGAGVVPVITRVLSGTDEIVEDGINGRIVSIGDLDAMATALAEFQRDPGVWRRLAKAAYDTVRLRFPLERMASQWLSVFESVMARIEPNRQNRLLASWVARFARQAAAGGEMVGPAEAAARMRATLAVIAQRDQGPTLLYGAGEHTKKVLDGVANSPVPIAGIIDDDPGLRGQLRFGLPIFGPDNWQQSGARSVVVSTDRAEDQVWCRLGRPIFDGLYKFRLYSDRNPELSLFVAANATCLRQLVDQNCRRIGIVAAGHWPALLWTVWEPHRDRFAAVVDPGQFTETSQGNRAVTPFDLPIIPLCDLQGSVDGLIIPHPNANVAPEHLMQFAGPTCVILDAFDQFRHAEVASAEVG